MGIPFYFYVITRTHPGILLQTAPTEAAGLYLDFNGAIYQAVQKLSKAALPLNDESIATETIAYFDWLIEKAGKDIKDIGVCLDGVAPRAKMMQQRKRRFMGMFRATLEKEAGLLVAGGAHVPSWDTCAISPGTAFMGTMAAHLRRRAAVAGAENIWVSPADEPGEGEHKIFERLGSIPAGGPTLIYGLDADLIMLSLVSHRPSIYLMREPTLAGIPGLPPPSPLSPFIYVNIDALRAGILSSVRQHYKWPVTDDALKNTYIDEAKTWIETYIVLCFFLGNDFLPPLPALTLKSDGLETLLHAYGRVRKMFPGQELVSLETGDMSWDMMAALLEDLAVQEDARVHEACVANVERRSHAREPADLIEFYPSVPQNRDPVAHAIASGGGGGGGKGAGTGTGGNNWRLAYYMGLFDIRRANAPQVMRESTMFYLKGLPWVFNYYTRRAKDPKWFYPYGYAPLVRDLVNTMQAEKAELENKSRYAEGRADGLFVEPVVQLLSILPPTSVDLLPLAARAFMTSNAPGCKHFYPKTFKVHTFLKTRLWECHPKLPVLDVDWIEARWASLKGAATK